ncbi:MAG: HAD-IA family hydrolase [Paracoccaceae bacterium]
MTELSGLTVVFDLDGTLADTSADLIAAANACFARMGRGVRLDPASAGDAAVAMTGARAMLRLGLGRECVVDEGEVDAWYPRLLDAYSADLATCTTLYPGALTAVAALRAAGAASVICTNKPEGLAERLMVALGAREAFSALVGADTLPVRKPDAEPLREAVRRAGGDPGRAVMIGDTRTDLETARSAGVACVLVSFGPGDMSKLTPDAWLSDYADLPEVLRSLLG